MRRYKSTPKCATILLAFVTLLLFAGVDRLAHGARNGIVAKTHREGINVTSHSDANDIQRKLNHPAQGRAHKVSQLASPGAFAASGVVWPASAGGNDHFYLLTE